VCRDLPSGLTVFVGVFLAAAGVFCIGFGSTAFSSEVLGLEVEGVAVVFLTADAGFEALPTGVFVAVTGVFLMGADVPSGFALATGSVFCVPSGVLAFTGVAFAGAGAFGAAGVVDAPPAALSFLGAFRTGAVAVSVEVSGFFTGVAFVAVDVGAFVGVAVVFFAVCPVPCAVFERLPTLAIGVSARSFQGAMYNIHCKAAFCCLSWSTADILIIYLFSADMEMVSNRESKSICRAFELMLNPWSRVLDIMSMILPTSLDMLNPATVQLQRLSPDPVFWPREDHRYTRLSGSDSGIPDYLSSVLTMLRMVRDGGAVG
jgi:hypothetical protein